MIVGGLKLKRLGRAEFEYTSEGEDGHIRKEDGSWVLTVFDASIADPNAAFIGAGMYATLRAAVRGAISGEGVVT